jgi:hypothetical protein
MMRDTIIDSAIKSLKSDGLSSGQRPEELLIRQAEIYGQTPGPEDIQWFWEACGCLDAIPAATAES